MTVKEESEKASLKEESEKASLKLNIQKTKIMASKPIISWKMQGEKAEAVTVFFFPLGFKITANGDCSHEIKRHLLIGREAMISLDSVLKSRGITLPRKIRLVKAMVFSIVIHRCECRTTKKPGHYRATTSWSLSL